MNITKIVDFLGRTTFENIISLILVLLFWENIYLVFIFLHIALMWILIPATCKYTASIDMYLKKLQEEKKLKFRFLKQVNVPASVQKIFYGCSDGKFLWISFAFQIILYLYIIFSVIFYGFLIRELLIGNHVTVIMYRCICFWLIFHIMYTLVLRISCFIINLFFKRKDGKPIKEDLVDFRDFSAIDHNESRELKASVDKINRQATIIKELKKVGLRSYKKGYYIKENELTGFENIVKSEYPELGYNICRSSKKASITVYEKEKEDVLFHATLKK